MNSVFSLNRANLLNLFTAESRVKLTPRPAKSGSVSVINNAEEEGLGVIVLYGFWEAVIVARVTSDFG